jgi:hypothetical protein
MIRPVTLAAIIALGLLFVAGFMGGGDEADTITIRTMQDKRHLSAFITLNSVNDDYRWVSVYACSAAMLEHGTFCTGDFERESSFEVTRGRRSYPVEWRDLPGGTMQITAMAFDADDKVLARGQVTVFRGR